MEDPARFPSKIAVIFLCAGFFISGCVSATFAYKYYYPEFASYTGKLLGSKPSEDLDGETCKPGPNGHPCVVMLKPEFQALTLDYMTCQDQLVKCQRNCN